MRHHNLRYDIWLCLLFSVLLVMGTEKIANKVLPQKYEEHKASHKVDVGEVGGIADETVFELKMSKIYYFMIHLQ